MSMCGKQVRYNGGTESYYGCTDPRGHLVKGHVYTIISEEVLDWQTNYTLRGVMGKFNSVWFDEI